MINPLYRGGWPKTFRTALWQSRIDAKVKATLRHRSYSVGFAAALANWKQFPWPECWGMGHDGPVHRLEPTQRQKRRNLARERVNSREIPF